MRVLNNLPVDNPASGVRLGVIRATDLRADTRLPDLDTAVEKLAEDLATETEHQAGRRDERRRAVRDMLRNGRYKPTGRGKPSSEYLVRAATSGDFPRINALVDINNLVSLAHGLPISIWDLEAAAGDSMVFRLGREDEEYVFNPSGQVLRLQDLVIGCRADEDRDIPIVSPVKDSQATKTHDQTTSCGVAIYAPAGMVDEEELLAVCDEFRAWLLQLGDETEIAAAVVNPGNEALL